MNEGSWSSLSSLPEGVCLLLVTKKRLREWGVWKMFERRRWQMLCLSGAELGRPCLFLTDFSVRLRRTAVLQSTELPIGRWQTQWSFKSKAQVRVWEIHIESSALWGRFQVQLWDTSHWSRSLPYSYPVLVCSHLRSTAPNLPFLDQ